MKALIEYGAQVLPAPTHLALHPLQPGVWVHLKPWKTGGLQVQLTPKWTDPTCDPNHPSALKSQGSLRGGSTLEGKGPRSPTSGETTWGNGPP